MKRRRQKLLEDRQTIVGRSSADENSLPIPTDLIHDIFLRLSPKYIGRCRCVSKLWSSILDHQDFTDQFLKKCSTRPQLLFACEIGCKVYFFSSAQPQNPDKNTPPISANYRMSLHLNHAYQIHSPINGLVCTGDFSVLDERKRPAVISVICNPTTRQSFTLPKMKTKRNKKSIFFGYDPVEKQFKVLSMTWSDGRDGSFSEEHQVLTLETGKLSWRMIKCDVPDHYPKCNSVCINGVLYYEATLNMPSSSDDVMLICFDVRSEKFSFIKATEPFNGEATLINYKGKLVSFSWKKSSFEMWVLDDLEKKKWSKHSYKLPPQWQNIVPESILKCVGVTGSNEIVFSEHTPSDSFYVLYYNLEKGTIRRVEIQGIIEFLERRVEIQEMEELVIRRVYTFLNHVEDVKLMKGFI